MITDQVASPYDLFVSNAEADRAWVEGYLLPALGLPAGRTISRQTFRPGASVVAEFERAIGQSLYAVLVLSPAYLSDEWSMFGEALASFGSIAAQRDRLVPLLLEPCSLPLHIDFRVRLDCTDEARWEGEIGRLRTLLEQPAPAPARINCPYPGMVPFSEKDARFFYGREAEIQKMLLHFRHQRFLFVIGPSGSGKSSLVRAGLLPRLEQSHQFPSGFWRLRHIRPGAQPLQSLAQALGGDSADLPRAIDDVLTTKPRAERFLLMVDQFEELFTQAGRADQARFISALQTLRGLERCAVLVAMRADFYPNLMASALWPIDPAQRLEIATLRGGALREAIERPAQAVGVYLQPGLVERLMADAADEPGVLPLLQETMVLLWDAMKHRLIATAAYEQLGRDGRPGLAVAMATKADAAIATLSVEQQRLARRIFLRLVQFGQGRPDTRRQQPLSELLAVTDDPQLFEQTLHHLVDHRLLIVSGEEGGLEPKVDIAHEQLIVAWPQGQKWVQSRREAELARRRLDAKVEEWIRLGAGSGGLLDEVEYREAERWLASSDAADLGYDEALPKLMQASRLQIEAARAAESRRARRRLIAWTAIPAGVAVMAIIVAWVTIDNRKQRARAEEQARFSLSQKLAAQAIYHADDRFDLASLLSLEAYRIDTNPDTRSSIVEVLQHNPKLAMYLRGHADDVMTVAFSADGRTLASAGRDNTLILWDVATRRRLHEPLRGHTDWIWNVAFSPDGKTLVSGGRDDRIIMWDVASARQLGAPLIDGGPTVASVAFSPDGSLVAAGGDKGTCLLWDVASRRLRGRLSVPLPDSDGAGDILSVAFSPDGRLLAAGSDEGSIVLWDVRTGRLLGRLLGGFEAGENDVNSVAFSPAGVLLAAGSQDGTIVFWDISTRERAGPPLVAHTNSVFSVTFSPDGKTLVTGGGDHRIRLWDVASRQSSHPPLTGHADLVNSVAFSPDGTLLASGSADDAAILWDLTVLHRLGRPLSERQVNVHDVAFSPEGKLLASSGEDGSVVLWDVASRRPLGPPLVGRVADLRSIAFSADGRTLAAAGWNDKVALWDVATGRQKESPIASQVDAATCVAFSPDRRMLASGHRDGSVMLWNVAAGERRHAPLLGHRHLVWSLAFHPDGQMVASGSEDGTILLWDVASGRSIGQLLSHETVRIQVGSVAFSPDGTVLASGYRDGLIVLWDVARRRKLVALPGHSNWVWGVAFTPDGGTLASGSKDGRVILWDVATRQRIGKAFIGHEDEVHAVAFSPDGRMLASGSDDDTVILWDVSFDSWRARACRIANRDLTQEEWERYLGSGPRRATCSSTNAQ